MGLELGLDHHVPTMRFEVFELPRDDDCLFLLGRSGDGLAADAEFAAHLDPACDEPRRDERQRDCRSPDRNDREARQTTDNSGGKNQCEERTATTSCGAASRLPGVVRTKCDRSRGMRTICGGHRDGGHCIDRRIDILTVHLCLCLLYTSPS